MEGSCLEPWKKITSDIFNIIIDIVRNGLKVDFEGEPIKTMSLIFLTNQKK